MAAALSVFAALFFLHSPLAAADQVIKLFSGGNQVSDYEAKILALKAMRNQFPHRTFLEFSRATRIEVNNFLGSAGATAVFRRADGRVLRVPVRAGLSRMPNITYLDVMNYFFESYGKLNLNNIGVAIFPEDSRSPEFITVGYFPAKFTWEEFKNDPAGLIEKGLINPSDYLALHKAFDDFIVKLSPYSKIGDFKPAQIASDGVEWKLLDGETPIELASKPEDETPFDAPYMRPELRDGDYAKYTAIVRQRRACIFNLAGFLPK